jgi:histidinol-phosphate aminotransferase
MGTPQAHNYIQSLKAYHTGVACQRDPDDLIRLSFNEGAFGPSPKALTAYQAANNTLHRYPEMTYFDLRQAIATHYSINPDAIICGAGSDELLMLLGRVFAGPGDEVMYSQYGFAVYPIVAKAAGATAVCVPEKDLRTDIDGFIARITPKTKMVLLANPNNPTGSYIDHGALRRLHAALPEHVLLVYDAAYAEYVTVADYEDGIALAREYKNVIMLRTFSKIHALGGLRIGWGYGDSSIIDMINRIRNPFNISTPSAHAAIAALADRDFQRHSVEHNTRWRDWLAQQLQLRNSVKVYPSVGNFLLIGLGSADRANGLMKHLAERKIQIRAMGGYQLPDHVRITVGREEEIKTLLDAMNQFLDQA